MAEHVEIREKQNGTWDIWIPEEGWIPCTCDKCKSITEAPLRLSFYKPTDLEDAKKYLSDTDREIRVIPKKTMKEKNEGKGDAKQGKSSGSH